MTASIMAKCYMIFIHQFVILYLIMLEIKVRDLFLAVNCSTTELFLKPLHICYY